MNLSESILGDAWAIHPKVAQGNRALIKAILEGKEYTLPTAKQQGIQIFAAKKNTATFLADGSMLWDADSLSQLQQDSFAVMPVQGTITKFGDLCSIGTSQMGEMLATLGTHPKIKGVLLRIDSGGGMVSGTENFAAVVRDFKANYNKPIAAVMEDMTASAAYWIASQADKVFVASKTTEVGSIGVLTTVVNDKKYWEDMGIDIQRVYATNSFNKNKEIEDALNGDMSPLQSRLDQIRDVFVADVRRARRSAMNFDSMPKEKGVPIVFTGATFMGEKAVEMGLADAMGTAEDALRWLDKEKRKMDKESTIGSTVAISLQKGYAVKDQSKDKPTVAAAKQPKQTNFDNQKTSTKMSIKKFFLATLATMGIVSAKTAENKEMNLEQLAEGLSENSTIDEAVVASIAEDAAKKATEAANAENQNKFKELADKIEASAKMLVDVMAKLGENKQTADALKAEIASLKGATTANKAASDGKVGDPDNLEAHPQIKFMRAAGALEDMVEKQKACIRAEMQKNNK